MLKDSGSVSASEEVQVMVEGVVVLTLRVCAVIVIVAWTKETKARRTAPEDFVKENMVDGMGEGDRKSVV